MPITRRTFFAGASTAAGVLAVPSVLRAQSAETELVVHYSNAQVFNDLMAAIAKTFQAEHPSIKVTLRVPDVGYEEILQRNLRDAITNTLPDVAFHGLSRQRSLEERGIPVDLKPFMDADAETKTLGFSPTLLSMGQIGTKQVGIGFSISTPLLYYNPDLVKAAGGDPEKLPTSWDEVIKLAAAIHDPAKSTTGMFYDWTISGNWGWQALVRSFGGSILSEDETKVAFTDARGRDAMRTLQRMVVEGKMPDINLATSVQDMAAGRLGITMQSAALITMFTREINDRFKLVCGRYPMSAPNGRIPAGGNAAMMFTKNPAKQKAAWEFIKFATGPRGATMMVNATGYMPATTIPAEREDMLAKFYREHPNHMVSVGQQDVITGWYAFPGQNALRITDVIKDNLQTVVARRGDADPTNEAMGAAVQRLLPTATR